MRTIIPKRARILITGCATGIGRALAVELHNRGYVVIATARYLDAIADIECAEKLVLDVMDAASVEQAVAQAAHVDILINNAGVSMWGPVEACDLAAVRSLFETNTLGPMRVAQAVLPAMRARRNGLILQISSAAGRSTSPLVGWYSASKHALEAASEAARIELASFGVRVSCISLGAVTSALADHRLNFDLPEYSEVTAFFRARLLGRRRVPTSAAYAASAIADAMEDGGAQFRYDATEDSRTIVANRRRLSDSEYEAELLDKLLQA
jgi:NADP-dependent 3-hydroxy acid dehydrogenase YdfG